MRTTIKSIYKGFTNTMRMPYTVAYFACGHGVEMIYRDNSADKHAPSNWALQPGSVAECVKCDENRMAVAKIIEFAKTPQFSHMTLRDMTASQTGEWMTFCAYRIEPTSPTQCCYEMGVEANAETEAAFRNAGIRFERGPSRGNMARG